MTAHTPGPLLDGRWAVVTGGAQGIGRGVVLAFAAHGARVLLVDTDEVGAARTAEDAAALGARPEVLVADATAPETAAAIAGRCEPDVLVNNVGHFLFAAADFHRGTPAQWRDLAAVNLDHVLQVTHALLPGMIGRGGGSVISLTTVEAHRAIPGQVVYSAYKAAVTGFTRSLAVEVGRYGVRVNAIAPDLIETPQVPYDRTVPDEDRFRWGTWAPLGRPGTPDDIAGAALFLASPLSAFVTGTTIHVDGGSYAAGGWFRRLGEAPDGREWTNRPLEP